MATAIAEKHPDSELSLFQDPRAGTREEIIYLECDTIRPDPDQPRTDVEKSLDDDPAFVESVRVQGVLEPIEVRMVEGQPQLVFGERRLKASIRVGRKTIPAIVRSGDAVEDELRRLLRQAAENHHKTLSAIDEARFFKRIQLLSGASVAKLAKIVGRPKSTVSDRLAMVDAPAPFQRFFVRGDITEAGAPILKKYAEVPLAIVEKAANIAEDSWQFRQARTDGKPVPLGQLKQVLDNTFLHNLMAEVPEEIALAYQGPTVKIGTTIYATDAEQLRRVAEKKARRDAETDSAVVGASAARRVRRADPHEARRRREGQLRRLQFSAIVEKLPSKIEGGWVEFVVDTVAKEVHQDTHRVLCSQLGLDKRKGESWSDVTRRHAKSLDQSGLTKLVLQLLIVPDVSSSWGAEGRMTKAAALAKVDLKKVKLPDPPKKAAKEAKGKAKRFPGHPEFMKPFQPNAALGAIVGTNPITRVEITKKLWGYIKRHGLQDKKERRIINADAKLKVVFGGRKKVSMFEMTKLVAKNLGPVKR